MLYRSAASAESAALSMRKMTLDPHAVVKPRPSARALREKFQKFATTSEGEQPEIIRRNVRYGVVCDELVEDLYVHSYTGDGVL